MTNQQFIEYINDKRKAIEAELNDKDLGLSASAIVQLKRQMEMLTDAKNIMTYGTGPARRRFRRDYESNLALQGVKLEG